MTTKHTPGPWTITRKHTPPIFDRGCIAIGPDIAAIQVPELDTASEANARLIAAAPDLLAALARAVAYLDANRPKGKISDIFSKLNEHENDVLKPARAAIAKAKGESK
jgi:hypothetical protein